MSVQWTTEQVLGLAPDESSKKAGRGLANKKPWGNLGRNEGGLWGECQGSGSKPYQACIDLTGPAFKCSCPSQKFPCKHCLGLFLLFAENNANVPEGEPPAWMADWLAKRTESVQKKEAKKAAEADKTPEELAKAAEQAAKRVASREKKVDQGLQGLDRFLRDIVRQGFSTANVRDMRFWDTIAASMVDAQAPGVAKMLREIPSLAITQQNWQERLLERIGLLYLLIEGYSRIESLPAPTQADIREALGFTVRREDVLADPNALRVSDLWQVVGQYAYEDTEGLRVRRSWLFGLQNNRLALVLHFAYAKQPMEAFPPVGVTFEGKLAYFPGAVPLRAIVEEKQEASPSPVIPAGHATTTDMLSAYADAVAANPWQETYPGWVQQVTPVTFNDSWHLRDRDGYILPIVPNWDRGWNLLAVSGGHPLPSLFGEWDGRFLRPLTAILPDGRATALA